MRRVTLRRLLAFAIVCALFAITLRYAFSGGADIVAIPLTLFLWLVIAIPTKRWGLSLLAVCTLAMGSYLTTQAIGHGKLPVAEMVIVVKDDAGEAIPGAEVRAYYRNRFGFSEVDRSPPFAEFQRQPLITDAYGRVTLHSYPQGFGGSFWFFLWCIRIDPGAPKYELRIRHDGFREARMSATELLFDHAHDEDLPIVSFDVDGQTQQMRSIEVVVRLARAGS